MIRSIVNRDKKENWFLFEKEHTHSGTNSKNKEIRGSN